MHGYRLAGYMFFGSGYRLVDQLKASLGDAPAPRCVLLDFEGVSGVDFSAVNALCRFVLATRGSSTRVVLCAGSDQLRGELQRNLPPPVFDEVLFEADADLGLERCEDIILEDHRVGDDAPAGKLLDTVGDAMERQLDRQATFEELLEDLGEWVDVREHEAGSSIVAVDQPFAGIGLIAQGRASVYDAEGSRLAQLGTGDFIEPYELYGTRVSTRATVADDDCRTANLTPAALRLLESSNGTLALKLYRYLLGAADHDPVSAPQDSRTEET